MASSSGKPSASASASPASGDDDVNQQPPCLGTTTVTIGRGGSTGKKKKEGLLTVFHIRGEGEGRKEEGLRLSITDGKAVYHGKIVISEVNMPGQLNSEKNTTKELAEKLAEFLLLGHDEVPIDYEYALKQQDEDSGGGDLITVRIKYYRQEKNGTYNNNESNQNKTMDSDKVVSMDKMKQAVKCKLERDNNNSKNDNKDDLYRFFKTLGESINQGNRKEIETKDQMEMVTRQRDSWKDIADKLEGSWQKEKDTMLQNFIKLYNATQEELQKTREELNQKKDLLLAMSHDIGEPPATKKKKATTKKNASDTTATTATKRGRAKQTKQQRREEDDDDVPEHPDDIDLERNAFDDDMVDKLANGRKVNLASTVIDVDDDEQEEDDDDDTSSKKKKAKSTNNKKNVKSKKDDDLFDDDSTPPPPKKKTRLVSRKQESNYNDSDSDDSTAKRVALLFKNTAKNDSDDD